MSVEPASPPGIRTEPRANCVSCGAVGKPLYVGLHDNLFAAPGIWSHSACTNDGCGLVWLNPMPRTEDLPLAYSEYYTHGSESDPRASVRFAKRVYRIAVDAFLWIAGIPSERKRARLMFVGDESPSTLLDIGCGQGAYLIEMAKRGWRVAGVDFDPSAVKAAKTLYGLDVSLGTVDTAVKMGRKYSVVTASHVIEHVPDPVSFLSQCRRLLDAGGRVVIRTPNLDSLGHRKYGRAWRGLEPPRHLHLFTMRGLEACARRAGFQRTRCFTTSVGADGILLASHFLRKKGEFRPGRLTANEMLEAKALGPLLALAAKFVWWLDRSSGEEICAILTNDDLPSSQ